MRKKLRFAIKYFLLLFTVAVVICIIIFMNFENNRVQSKLNEIKLNEEIFVNLKSDHIIESFTRALSDLKYISNDFSISSMDINTKWKTILESNGIYSSITYVDLDGYEQLRIDYIEKSSITDGQIDTISVIEKSYFQNALNLEKGQFFVSDLIINENDIEDRQSTIIFCTPIYSTVYDSEKVGILILEYNAKTIMEMFTMHLDRTRGIAYLLNDFGYWDSISGEYKEIDPEYYELAYGAGILPIGKWEEIKDSMHSISDRGLYTFTELNFSKGLSESLEIKAEDLIISNNTNRIITFIDIDTEYEYYIKDAFHLKLTRVISNKYAYLIACFIVSIFIVILLTSNKSKFDKMKNSSHFDSLTKTYTRRQGFVILEEYILDIHHYKNICLCFIDINGLKEVNDTLGHPFGDELIVSVSDTIKQTIRQEDIVIRMGGDEFIIVFMKVEKAIAETIWSRIAHLFNDINDTEDRDYVISVSHGIVEIVDGEKKIDLSTIITEADDKMYKEKIRLKKHLTVLRRDS